MFVRRSLGIECAEISSFPGFRIFLARIQPVLAGFKFSDHDRCRSARCVASGSRIPVRLTAKDFRIAHAGVWDGY